MPAGASSLRSLCVLVCALAMLGAPSAASAQAVPTLGWETCGDATGVECATASVPLDYDEPDGEAIELAVARVAAKDPANRIGSLFFNFGGPGSAAVGYLQATGGQGLFDALNQRFDIVAFDPRGVGQSEPSIDCDANQETEGIYAQPFTTPLNLDTDALLAKVRGYTERCLERNGGVDGILSHVSTANVARDLDLLRRAVGEAKISFLGYSYGTLVGATYASLFPESYRALLLDGPVDATRYINRPWDNLAEQTAGFERAFGRMMQACAADQTACSGFGGADPWKAFDELVARADAEPIPADGYTADPRPVDGGDILHATIYDVYAKQYWGEITHALAAAAAGDGSEIRALTDGAYDREEDGSYGPGSDLYFTIGASEQNYPRGEVDEFLARGANSWASFDHFWFNHGYVELNYTLWPARDEDAFAGPFTIPAASPTALVVATTYDPATPYRGGLRLVDDLGNARLLTMSGDGHTAYNGNSACIDAAVESYLLELTLPAEGTVCQQEVAFAAPPAAAPNGVESAQLKTPERIALEARTRGG